MRDRSYCSPVRRPRVISLLPLLCVLVLGPRAGARTNDAPAWMHALAGAPLPAHDDQTDAVLLYREESLTVLSVDKTRSRVRAALKILRPSGRDYGLVAIPFSSRTKILNLHGWCIPAQGKDYEVKDKDAIDVALPKIEGSELISDVKARVLHIPAPDPGNIVGYEYELEEQPMILQDRWNFQETIPVRESHYSLQIPPGWEYKASWLNYPEVKPTPGGNGEWNWAVSDVKAIQAERDMPPLRGVSGRMIIAFFPPGGPAANGFTTWKDMGTWYLNLTNGRRLASPEIQQKVNALTASAPTQLAKMQALAQFVQREIRYVAIELGIGGMQPHPAAEVFTHRYGDCKDKATLMGSMLHEIGVDSFYVVINVDRGVVTPDTPPGDSFDHVIVAIKLPEGLTDPSLVATMEHPRLGRLLFFDPTNDMTPFGLISGHLQANYGLLVTPEGGELVELPVQPTIMNAVSRSAQLALDSAGTLKGDVQELCIGDPAAARREALLSVTKASDRIKPIESLLANSMSAFHITRASVLNLQATDQPLIFNYSFQTERYATEAGKLLLLRPRVMGSHSSALLETKEPRRFPIEFNGPRRDMDNFDITLPPGYVADDLPSPVAADYSFASYHSRTIVKGNVIHYARTFEVKELSVPPHKAPQLKELYRIISTDERATVVLVREANSLQKKGE